MDYVAAHPGDCCLLSTDVEHHLQTLLALVRSRCRASAHTSESRTRPGYLLLDSTIVRAHRLRRVLKQSPSLRSKSAGGFVNSNVAVDALGNPLRLRLTAGQRHDITQAHACSPTLLVTM